MEGVRGFAVLLVFFVHFDGLFRCYLPTSSAWSYALATIGRIGHSGVDLFFVLSGYLIYGALMRRKLRYSQFVARRIQRIYPPFLVVLCSYLVLSALFPAQNKVHGSLFQSGLYIAENFLLLPGILNIQPIVMVTWSLSLELFFYLSAPILIRLFSLKNRTTSSRVLILSALWASHLTLFVAFPFLRPRMAGFTAGMLLFEAAASKRFRNSLTVFGEVSIVPLSLFLMTTLLLVRAEAPGGSLLGLPVSIASIGVAALNIGCFALVLYSCHFVGILRLLFSWTPIRYLGNMSYSYYLIHGLTLKFIAAVLTHYGFVKASPCVVFLLLLPVSLAATCATATLLFAFIEKRLSICPRPLAG